MDIFEVEIRRCVRMNNYFGLVVLFGGLTVFIVGKRKALYAVAMMSPYKPLTLLLYMAEGPRLPTIGPME